MYRKYNEPTAPQNEVVMMVETGGDTGAISNDTTNVGSGNTSSPPQQAPQRQIQENDGGAQTIEEMVDTRTTLANKELSLEIRDRIKSEQLFAEKTTKLNGAATTRIRKL